MRLSLLRSGLCIPVLPYGRTVAFGARRTRYPGACLPEARADSGTFFVQGQVLTINPWPTELRRPLRELSESDALVGVDGVRGVGGGLRDGQVK